MPETEPLIFCLPRRCSLSPVGPLSSEWPQEGTGFPKGQRPLWSAMTSSRGILFGKSPSGDWPQQLKAAVFHLRHLDWALGPELCPSPRSRSGRAFLPPSHLMPPLRLVCVRVRHSFFKSCTNHETLSHRRLQEQSWPLFQPPHPTAQMFSLSTGLFAPRLALHRVPVVSCSVK